MAFESDGCGDCRFCRTESLRGVAEEIADYIRDENNDLRRLITLTLPGEGLSSGDTFDAQVDAFRAMVEELVWEIEVRKGHAIDYVGGIEPMQNGNPHAHLLVDVYVDHSWLQHAWRDCGSGEDHGGFVKIQYAEGDPGDVADYVVGYLNDGVSLSNI